MKYLFFDVECSNCFNGIGKVCEFGYVLTDDNFNVIKKKDIPMSPGKGGNNRFCLVGRKGKQDIHLAYEYDYYYEQDELPHFYDEIKTLLTDQDTIVLGYSVDNDIRYLDASFKRYNLESLNYKAYDVQKMAFSQLKNINIKHHLEDIFKYYCGNKESIFLIPHLSRDDAFMTMRIFQKLCLKLNLSGKDMLKRYEECSYKSFEYLKEHYQKIKQKEIIKARKQMWQDFCDENKESALENSMHKCFLVDSVIASTKIKDVINLIRQKEMLPCKNILESDYIIVSTQKEIDVIKMQNKGIEASFILLDDFINEVNLASIK